MSYVIGKQDGGRRTWLDKHFRHVRRLTEARPYETRALATVTALNHYGEAVMTMEEARAVVLAESL